MTYVATYPKPITKGTTSCTDMYYFQSRICIDFAEYRDFSSIVKVEVFNGNITYTDVTGELSATNEVRDE